MLLYIDATSGGMMLQVLLSGAVGGIVFFKLAAGRLVDFVLRRKPGEMLSADDDVSIETADVDADDEAETLAA